MPRGRKKKVQDVDFFKTIEVMLGRALVAKEITLLAQAARNFVRDNFLVTDVYPTEIIEEDEKGICRSSDWYDDYDVDEDDNNNNGCHGAGHSDMDYYGRSEDE